MALVSRGKQASNTLYSFGRGLVCRSMATLRKTAVITGGSSGIGKEIAAVFREKGWEVHNISRSPCNVQGVVNHAADLAKTSEASRVAEELAEAMAKREKGVLSFVHCAARHDEDTVAKFDAEMMSANLAISVVTPGILTAKLLPHMSEGSSVILIGSTLSEKAVAGRVSYVTSKHAMVGLMRSFTQDLFGTGVHTALVCPGFTDTPMLSKAMAEGAQDFIKGFVSLRRLITPQEIAALVAFVAENPSVNGSILHANGGQKET